MTIQDTNGVLTAVDPNTTEEIFLALAKMKFSNTHIGGGFFTGANHGMGYSEEDFDGRDRSGTLHTGLDGQTPITATGNFIYENEWGTGGIDTRMWYVETEFDAPAIPLLIMADPSDLVGYSTVAAGIPGNSTSGTMAYSTGTITGINGWGYVSSADVGGGMSGSGLYVEIDTDGDGEKEYFVVGSLARSSYGGTQVEELPGTEYGNGYYTDYTQDFYHQLAGHMELVGVNPDDLPRYTLMSGFDENSSSHEVIGTFLNENIIGGSWHDTLSGGGGDDIFTGGAGSDTFIFDDSDGDDVIRDFNISEDMLDLSGIGFQVFDASQTNEGVLITYEFGEHSILLEGATLSEIEPMIPANNYNVVRISDTSRQYWYDTDQDDAVRIGQFGSMVYAGSSGGNDYFDTTEGTNSKLTYRNSDSGVTVDFNNQEITKQSGGVDTWSGDWLHVAGSNYDDVFHGADDSEIIWTLNGDDQVYSGGGDDRIVLHSGTKIIDGGDGYDSITLRSGSDDMYIYAESDPRHTDGMSSFSNVEYVDAFKTSNDIYLGSGTGVEILNASGGNDNLYIYANSVEVIGGSGSDTFNINPDNLLTSTTDIVVQDFTASDTLIILGYEIDLDSSNDLPDGMSFESSDDGYLQIMFGDNDSVTLSNMMADSFI